MGNVFFTSDLHIGHKLVSGIRGFHDPNEKFYRRDGVEITGGWAVASGNATPDPDLHDAHIAANWDATVRPDDQVIILGDISINGGQHALDWIEARPGIKHLIAGNHDPVHPQDRRAPKKLPHWLKYFETIQPFARRKLNGHNFLLSHFPYASWGDGPEREGSRFEQYRLPDMGMPLLHGHTHGQEREHGHMLHVGLDAWEFQLVPQQAVLEWLEQKESE